MSLGICKIYHFLDVYLIIIVEQFTSLLSLHPEYVLVFYECQHAGVSSPPSTASASANGNSKTTPTEGLKGQSSSSNGHTVHLITLS